MQRLPLTETPGGWKMKCHLWVFNQYVWNLGDITWVPLKRNQWRFYFIILHLFILALETLATKNRSDKNIKIGFLADDITLLLHDLNSVKYSVSILKSFQHSSRLKINIEKTQILNI